jgi:hypothetical protein
MKEKQVGEGSSKMGSGKGGQKNYPRGQRKKKGGGKDDRDAYGNCGKKGHWAKDCHAPYKEQVNLTQEEDEESMLMARVSEIV